MVTHRRRRLITSKELHPLSYLGVLMQKTVLSSLSIFICAKLANTHWNSVSTATTLHNDSDEKQLRRLSRCLPTKPSARSRSSPKRRSKIAQSRNGSVYALAIPSDTTRSEDTGARQESVSRSLRRGAWHVAEGELTLMA